MAKNKISEWSATAANNTDIGGIDIAEGCAPSGINNAIRELMAQVKDQQTGTDADNFTVGGNLVVTGTTTATALTTTGNTVLGDTSADTLNVGNGGLFKDASGNVGIGTTSPDNILHLSSNAAVLHIEDPRTTGDGSHTVYIGAFKAGVGFDDLVIEANTLQFKTIGFERARIDRSGNLLVGSTNTAGSLSNSANIIGGLFSTFNGSTSSASGVATSFATLPNVGNGLFLVSVGLGASAVATYNPTALIRTSGTNAAQTNLSTATTASISLSGLTVQFTQNSGGTNGWTWSIIRLS